MERKGVSAKDIADQFSLEIVHQGKNFASPIITIPDVNRPGLQLMGYFDYFDPRRLQIIGKAETMLLADMEADLRRQRLEGLLAYDIPALIIARGMEVFPECLELASKYGRTLLSTKETTVSCSSQIIEYLNNSTAASITRHGVLLDIYGEGVMIIGDSGIGKSETAIELIKRGHRLVADDAVEIRRVGNILMGTAPELIRHYIELRGIGVVDVQQLFGMSAVKHEAKVELIVKLEPWQEDKVYDRLGIEGEYTQILDLMVPQVTIPVRPGRNLAVIVEVAAMNDRQKKYGYNAAETFAASVEKYMLEAATQPLSARPEAPNKGDKPR